MPKNRTRSGARKHFRTTNSSRTIHEQTGAHHLLRYGSSHKTRHLVTDQVLGTAGVKHVKRMLGV